MASPQADSDALSGAQQDALAQFIAVTNQDVDAALPLLRRCEWNVQVGFGPFNCMPVKAPLR